jgi:hypothetical protein
MSRPKEAKEARGLGNAAYKIFYCLALFLIAAVWIYAFRSYFDSYDRSHPDIAWAMPWVQVDMVTARGVFLWDETRLAANRSGTVTFPQGRGPVRVQKGATVARIKSGSSVSEVKSPAEGYFVAGTDGSEGNWRYSSLWPGTHELPESRGVELIKEGSSVKNGGAIGKIVPQPQSLRFIGYADNTGSLERYIASNRLMVKMDALDTPSRAPVRVYDFVEHRVKMYLDMPWFPPELVMSRNYDLIIETGATAGVTIPESAIAIMDGRTGTYVLRGSSASFAEVKGRTIDGDRFLVTSGVRLGDAVRVNGDSAREGRVKLW